MTEAKILVFRLGDQEFGVDVRDVREVITVPEVAALPKSAALVDGVFNLRGSIIAAVDGAEALGVPEAPGPRTRTIVADVDRHAIGLLVDGASEVLTIDEEDVRPLDKLGSAPTRPDVARGVILVDGRVIVLLDMTRILPEAERDDLPEAIAPEDGAG